MTDDPHEDLVEASVTAYAKANPFLKRSAHEAAIRAVIFLIAERTEDATPEMLEAGVHQWSDDIWTCMHRASALRPKEKEPPR